MYSGQWSEYLIKQWLSIYIATCTGSVSVPTLINYSCTSFKIWHTNHALLDARNYSVEKEVCLIYKESIYNVYVSESMRLCGLQLCRRSTEIILCCTCHYVVSCFFIICFISNLLLTNYVNHWCCKTIILLFLNTRIRPCVFNSYHAKT